MERHRESNMLKPRSCFAPISKVERQISDKVFLGATKAVWLSVNIA